MTSWLIPILLVALVIPLAVALLRANELFVLEVCRAGKVEVLRGRVPQRLLSDIGDVIRTARFRQPARLRVVVEDGRAVFSFADGDGVPAALRQRLRNTLALWPVAKLRAAPRR